jgi:hypothetical protein
MADWFASLANQAMQLVDSYADSLVNQANEAQEKIRTEQQKILEEEQSKKSQLSNSSKQLPWETTDKSLQGLSSGLMEVILKLSLNEKNFTITPENSSSVYFDFSDFISTAFRLLKIDANLAYIHSKVSPKMDEQAFWCNYYCRIVYLRAKSGIDGMEAKMDSAQYVESDLIFPPNAPPAKNTYTVPVAHDTMNVKGGYQVSSTTPLPSDTASSSARQVDIISSTAKTSMKDDKKITDDDLDLNDLDDLDLDGLDDEIGDSFEEVEKSDCTSSDELEAQIALELAQFEEDD